MNVGEPFPAESLGGVYALVVDSRPEPRSVLAAMLRYGGALVSAADSVPGALEALRLVKPDVLVADLALPASGAWALIAAVRALKPERGGVVPAIAIGASATHADEAHAHGFDAFMVQPVEAWALFRQVARLLPHH